jgi:hypothetical protein
MILISELLSHIEAIEKNPALYEESNFASRAEAIDDIEFAIIDRIDVLLGTTDSPEELMALRQRAERAQHQLEAVDAAMFQRLRAEIGAGGCRGRALSDLIHHYTDQGIDTAHHDQPGYDTIDAFINGLLLTHLLPTETRDREKEMVFYQQTPARIIMELAEHISCNDVFYDLGSGLGQVGILVHLLSGATTWGVEFEPTYCEYAKACAAALGLTAVEFINTDARTADYSDGTVFFLYTPFTGRMLDDVLEELRDVSHSRTIRLFTYGPCTPQISRVNWLQSMGDDSEHIYKLGAFISRGEKPL